MSVKIKEVSSRDTKSMEHLIRDGRRISGTKKGVTFADHITRVEGQSRNQKLESLLQDIEKQGERLKKSYDLKDLLRYKKLIAEYLSETISGSNKFSKEDSIDRRGRHRVFAMIREVDDRLSDLTKSILEEEKSNIDLVKAIDEIKGLLLDLYM